jgi:hypothetical protein
MGAQDRRPMRHESSEQGLARLALRWPAHRRRLALLRDGDEDFASLCAAYDEACDALDAWRRSGSPNAGTRVMEYQELVSELEADVMQLLIRKNA